MIQHEGGNKKKKQKGEQNTKLEHLGCDQNVAHITLPEAQSTMKTHHS